MCVHSLIINFDYPEQIKNVFYYFLPQNQQI